MGQEHAREVSFGLFTVVKHRIPEGSFEEICAKKHQEVVKAAVSVPKAIIPRIVYVYAASDATSTFISIPTQSRM